MVSFLPHSTSYKPLLQSTGGDNQRRVHARNPQSQTVSKKHGQKIRTTLTAGLIAIGFVLVLNLIILIWSSASFKAHDGSVAVFTGMGMLIMLFLAQKARLMILLQGPVLKLEILFLGPRQVQ